MFLHRGLVLCCAEGRTTLHALGSLEARGSLFAEPQTEVYTGMLVRAPACAGTCAALFFVCFSDQYVCCSLNLVRYVELAHVGAWVMCYLLHICAVLWRNGHSSVLQARERNYLHAMLGEGLLATLESAGLGDLHPAARAVCTMCQWSSAD